MACRKIDIIDEMYKLERSLGNMTALIHSLSLVTTSRDIGSSELSRAIEATWELAEYNERKFIEIINMVEQVEENKDALKERMDME